MELTENEIEIVVKPNLDDAYKNLNNGLYFLDQTRRIDIVLVYQTIEDNPTKKLKREAFIRTLLKEGLEIEIQDEYGHIYEYGDSIEVKIIDTDNCFSRCNLVFVKINATWDTLCRYAEVMKIRKPMLNLGVEYDLNRKKFIQRLFEKFDFLNVFNIVDKRLQPIHRGFTWPFSTSKEYLFDIPDDKSRFFSPAERSLIVNYILRRASYRRIIQDDSNDESRINSGVMLQDNTDLDALEQAISDQAADIEMGVINGHGDRDLDGNNEDEEGNPQICVLPSEQDAHVSMDFGVAKLISEGVFESCFPLHEPSRGGLENEVDTTGKDNLRCLLYRNWVTMSNVFRIQPLDHIRLYFGEKIAFYFAWLGYYTYWLLPISLLGIIVSIVNVYNTFGDPVVDDICQSKNITMCPLICSHKGCKFWMLSSACTRFRLQRVLDNGVTVVMAIVTAIWASLFLEMWKRQQNRLAHTWNVHDMEYEDEPPRPEFVALIDKNYPRKVNLISGKEEPFIPFWRRRVPVMFFTYSTVILSVILALGFLVGIILYKLVTGALFRMMSNNMVSNMSNLFSSATGSMISLIIIMSLTLVYSRVATWLTDLEHHRTQSQYDSSVTLKLYMLEFVNNYSSVIYIGFIQPYTMPVPGVKSHTLIKPKGCPAGGCLLELCLQLTFIMIGKQIISYIKEYTIPRLRSSLTVYRLKKSGRKLSVNDLVGDDEKAAVVATEEAPAEEEQGDLGETGPPPDVKITKGHNTIDISNDEVIDTKDEFSNKPIKIIHHVEPELVRCFADNILSDPGPRPLFGEYLEMLIQFGFMIIFIPAFPLAPILALVNNIFEIRGDALKFTNALKRPVAQRVNDIGIWISILAFVTRIAVKSNALLIAFATTYVERFVFKMWYSPDGELDGFVTFSLSSMYSSTFNWTNLDLPHYVPLGTNETYCQFLGYRYPPWHEDFLKYTPVFWQIFAGKVIFIYLFENVVLLVMSIISMIVSDVPDKLRVAMKREAVLTNEIILKAELLRHKNDQASKIVAESFKKNVQVNKKPINTSKNPFKLRNKQKWKGTTIASHLLSNTKSEELAEEKI